MTRFTELELGRERLATCGCDGGHWSIERDVARHLPWQEWPGSSMWPGRIGRSGDAAHPRTPGPPQEGLWLAAQGVEASDRAVDGSCTLGRQKGQPRTVSAPQRSDG